MKEERGEREGGKEKERRERRKKRTCKLLAYIINEVN